MTNQIHTDYKAEVVAAEMILNGVSEACIILKAEGMLHRGKRNDVLKHTVEEDEQDDKVEKQIITSTREGLYDMLPQGLFHQPAPPKNANEYEVIDYFKQHRKEEKTARNFFLPFETAINNARIQNTVFDLTAFKFRSDANFYQSLEQYWPILKWMNIKQKAVFIKLLPVWHQLRGKLDAVNEVINKMMDIPIHIYLSNEKQINTSGKNASHNQFGKTLGLDFSIGKSHFLEDTEIICVEIQLDSYTDIPDFEKQQLISAKLLQGLCDYLLPVHLMQRWVYKVEEQHNDLVLFEKDERNELLLGVNMMLVS